MPGVVVDSSVWIDFFRDGTSTTADLLEELVNTDQAYISEIIRVELLSGCRHELEYRRLEDFLAGFPMLEMESGFWNQVALARFRLARQGMQASLPDVAIAVMARRHSCLLLTLDRSLMQIAKLLSIKLYAAH